MIFSEGRSIIKVITLASLHCIWKCCTSLQTHTSSTCFCHSLSHTSTLSPHLPLTTPFFCHCSPFSTSHTLQDSCEVPLDPIVLAPPGDRAVKRLAEQQLHAIREYLGVCREIQYSLPTELQTVRSCFHVSIINIVVCVCVGAYVWGLYGGGAFLQVIGDDFVAMRKVDPGATADTLHHLLCLARLVPNYLCPHYFSPPHLWPVLSALVTGARR